MGGSKILGQTIFADCKIFGSKSFWSEIREYVKLDGGVDPPLENCSVNALIDLKSNRVYHLMLIIQTQRGASNKQQQQH